MSRAMAMCVEEVRGFLRERVAACVSAGIARYRLVVDPGFGFGKALEHNLELLRGLGRLRPTDCRCLPACRASA